MESVRAGVRAGCSRWRWGLVPSPEETGSGQERQLASLCRPAPPQVLFPGVPTLTAGGRGLHRSGVLAHSSRSKTCLGLPPGSELSPLISQVQ